MKFKLGELFCGPGGMAFGAISTNFTGPSGEIFEIGHGWANDYDHDSCSTYLRNIPNAHSESVICSDVSILKIDELSEIDAFAYGFPCNDFSLVGEQKGFNGKFGGLYTYGVSVIDRFNPKFFVAENVGGLSSSNEGRAFKQIMEHLENAGSQGYDLTAHKYKSEEYGVSQTRHRIIIVGIRKDYKKKFLVPAPTHFENHIPVKDVLENIPPGALNNERTTQQKIVVERLKLIKPGDNVWNTPLPKHLQLNVKGAKLSQIYKRLDPNKPSYTITGSGGGGTHVYHYGEPRALTNRERARIQSFPDEYVFEGSKESVRKQIGMAVPPQLSKVIFRAILMRFAGQDYAHVPPNLVL
jgi:DNA (cytosine-5)-methyltransferase 1